MPVNAYIKTARSRTAYITMSLFKTLVWWGAAFTHAAAIVKDVATIDDRWTRTPPSKLTLRALVPFYIYPENQNGKCVQKEWLQIAKAGTAVAVILNVHNGPGKTDREYEEGLAQYIVIPDLIHGVHACIHFKPNHNANKRRTPDSHARRCFRTPESGYSDMCTPNKQSSMTTYTNKQGLDRLKTSTATSPCGLKDTAI